MIIEQQSEDWNCGIYSIYHGFKKLNISFDPKKETRSFRRIIPKTIGLSPVDILNILEKYDVGYEEIICSSEESEKTWIKNIKSKLKKGYPLILLTRDFGHWVTIIDYKENKFHIANSEVATKRVGKWSEKHLLSESRNPGESDIGRKLLPKIFGIDNLYAICITI